MDRSLVQRLIKDAPRLALVGVPGVLLVALLLFPDQAWWLALVLIAVGAIVLKLGLHQTPEPRRPIITRLGRMHRLGPPGLIFLWPGIEAALPVPIEIRPISQVFAPANVLTADGQGIALHFEVTWQLRPDITLIDAAIRQTLLKTPDQRCAMLEQTMNAVARQLFMQFPAAQIATPEMREDLVGIMRDSTNELLAPHGMMIETIFWRAAPLEAEHLRARQNVTITHEQVEALIRDIKLIQEHLPGVAPETLLAQQAWLDLLRRGITPHSAVPGLPYMPPRPREDAAG